MLEKIIGVNTLLKNNRLHKMSGSEPEFNTLYWKHSSKKIENNNCYAYAINSLRDSRLQKSVPGVKRRAYLKNRSLNHNNYIDCEKLWKEIQKDLGEKCIKLSNPYEAPPSGTYKAVMVVSPNRDFHFYRQDNDGTFSHKRGWAYNPSKLDASGKLITDPLTCDRDYGDLNYSEPCFAFSVPLHAEFGI